MTKQTFTLAAVSAAAAVLAKVEASKGALADKRSEATRNLFATIGGYAASDKGATVEATMPAVYSGWDDFKANVQKSRKTEISTMFDVARRGGTVFADCIEATVKSERAFKATFLRVVTFAKNNPNASGLARLSEVAAEKVETVQNTGDRFETVMQELSAVYKATPDVFNDKGLASGVMALQTFYQKERAAGRLRTTKEIAKPKGEVLSIIPG